MEEETKGWDSGEVEREVGSAERGYKEKNRYLHLHSDRKL